MAVKLKGGRNDTFWAGDCSVGSSHGDVVGRRLQLTSGEELGVDVVAHDRGARALVSSHSNWLMMRSEGPVDDDGGRGVA
jgi:hypothetical protein